MSLTKLERDAIDRFAAPVILKALETFKAMDLGIAMRNNVDLARLVAGDEKYISRLEKRGIVIWERMKNNQALLASFKESVRFMPFKDRIRRSAKRRVVIKYFLEQILKFRRPDLYGVIIYSRDQRQAEEYIITQSRRLTDLVLG